jgi:hypothetical protein
MNKKLATSLLLVSLLGFTSVSVNAATPPETKVISKTFVGKGGSTIAVIVSDLINKEAKKGWTYKTYIDINDLKYETKLFIFTK